MPPYKTTHRLKQPTSREPTTEQNTALLVTNADTISLMYPREMGYETDFLHTVFKLNSTAVNPLTSATFSNYRVEDAVFDNKTWSIYFILSNLTGGSEIVRLRRNVKAAHLSPDPTASVTTVVSADERDYSYAIAYNWLLTVVHRNDTAKVLSLDISVSQRKLYWFEFNKFTHLYSLGAMRLLPPPTSGLNLNQNRLNRVVLNMNEIQFAQDGYSYIAVVRDNDPLNVNNDVALFISNNETLIFCYLANMSCVDYLRLVNPSNQFLYQQTVNRDHSENALTG
jgi:hypothetical protein